MTGAAVSLRDTSCQISAYWHADETVGYAWRTTKRDGQQAIHLVSAPKQTPAHVQLERIKRVDWCVLLVVESEIDACSRGETNEEPD